MLYSLVAEKTGDDSGPILGLSGVGRDAHFSRANRQKRETASGAGRTSCSSQPVGAQCSMRTSWVAGASTGCGRTQMTSIGPAVGIGVVVTARSCIDMKPAMRSAADARMLATTSAMTGECGAVHSATRLVISGQLTASKRFRARELGGTGTAWQSMD